MRLRTHLHYRVVGILCHSDLLRSDYGQRQWGSQLGFPAHRPQTDGICHQPYYYSHVGRTDGCICAQYFKHLKGGRIFNHANVVLLWIMAIVLPIHSFISDNMVFACSDIDHYDWCLTDTPFVYAIVAVLVAILYKLAYDAAEEQKLTI